MDYKVPFARYRNYSRYLQPVVKNPLMRAYFSAVASLVMIIVLIIFAIRPTIITIVSLSKEIEDKKQLSSDMDRKINELGILQQQYQRLSADLPLVYAALPKEGLPLEAGFSLELTAIASHVELNQISGLGVDFLSTQSAKISIPSTVSVSGNYESIKYFINELEKGKRLFTVNSLSLGPAPSGASLEKIPMTLQGDYWYLR